MTKCSPGNRQKREPRKIMLTFSIDAEFKDKYQNFIAMNTTFRHHHGVLESRTGNSDITVKRAKIDALILERIDEIVSFFF